MPTAYDMMTSFKEIFGDKNCAARLVVMKDLMNTIMVEGTSVRDHVLKIDRKSTRLNSSHSGESRMPSSA